MKIIALSAVLFITGCPSTVERLHENSFTQGCAMSNTGVKLGYFNQEGSAELYKVKCSETLPENYCYSVDNQASGVKAKVGNCD